MFRTLATHIGDRINRNLTKEGDHMVTAIYSLLKVHGAELWLLFWFVCVAAYLGIGLLLKHNRTKSGIKNMLIGLMIAEVINDLMWAIIYYHNGTYLDYGIGAVYGLPLWILILTVTLIVFTAKSRNFQR